LISPWNERGASSPKLGTFVDGQFDPDDTHTQFGGGGGLFGYSTRGWRRIHLHDEYAPSGSRATRFSPPKFARSHRARGSRSRARIHDSPARLPLRDAPDQIGVGFQQSLGAGIFGGDGFLSAKSHRTRHRMARISGELVVRDLQPGELCASSRPRWRLSVRAVSFQITTVPGVKNMNLWAAMEFFSLHSPARQNLGSKPCPSPAWLHALAEYMPHRNRRENVQSGVVGGIVRLHS